MRKKPKNRHASVKLSKKDIENKTCTAVSNHSNVCPTNPKQKQEWQECVHTKCIDIAVMILTRETSTQGLFFGNYCMKKDLMIEVLAWLGSSIAYFQSCEHMTLIWKINGCKKCSKEHKQQQSNSCPLSIKELILNDFQMSYDNLFEPENIACSCCPFRNNDG